MPKRRSASNSSGFTLIEMAVVIVIVGIIISIVAGVLPSLIESSKIKQTRALLEKADYALQGYSLANSRLPFADGDGDGIEDTGVFVGSLPYRTVGLSSGDDIWGQPIKYAVYGAAAGGTNLTQNFADADHFCATLNAASTAAFDIGIVHTTTASPCGGADATNASNQAWVLASGGLKDLDGANGFFDECNGQAGAGFNIPGTVQSTAYDDLVRAFSINELNQKNCTGGSTPTPPEICDDPGGDDEDGDGFINCADSDCASHPACASTNLTITTGAIPSAVLDSTYMTTIAASGGTPAYDWTLTANGGFSDFSINSGTGTLSGEVDQCPGDYTLSLQVEDSATPTADTDTASYTLTVTSTLAVSGNSAITWSAPTQEETYTAAGSRLGSINWTLNTGGATGFEAVSTGDAVCIIRKTGSTTPGTYTFSLTATDANCASNTAVLTPINVTVTAGGGGSPGTIGGVVDTLEFDNSSGENPDITHIGGDIYAVAYTGPGDDGFVRTVQIDSSGNIAGGTIDSLQFDNSNGEDPDIIHISGDVYAIAYTGRNNDGYIATVTIAPDGQIGGSTTDTMEFDWWYCYEPDLILVGGEIVAVAYTGPNNDGYMHTIRIAATGQITNTVVDSLEFDTGQAYEADWLHIAGDTYAVAYAGTGTVSDGFVATVTIDGSGQIGGALLDSLEFDTGLCYDPDLINISGDVYAVVYRGPGDDGYIKTFQIADNGTISNAVIDTLEFDTSACNEPVIAAVNSGVYAIGYRGQSNDGYFVTVRIEDDGQIGNSVLDTLEFDTGSGYEPSIVSLGGGLFAIAYRGSNGDGYIATISMQ